MFPIVVARLAAAVGKKIAALLNEDIQVPKTVVPFRVRSLLPTHGTHAIVDGLPNPEPASFAYPSGAPKRAETERFPDKLVRLPSLILQFTSTLGAGATIAVLSHFFPRFWRESSNIAEFEDGWGPNLCTIGVFVHNFIAVSQMFLVSGGELPGGVPTPKSFAYHCEARPARLRIENFVFFFG